MSELELVWVRECEICSKEHRHMETHCIHSEAEIEIESGAFKARCERWYRTHVDALLKQQRLPQEATEATG